MEAMEKIQDTEHIQKKDMVPMATYYIPVGCVHSFTWVFIFPET